MPDALALVGPTERNPAVGLFLLQHFSYFLISSPLHLFDFYVLKCLVYTTAELMVRVVAK